MKSWIKKKSISTGTTKETVKTSNRYIITKLFYSNSRVLSDFNSFMIMRNKGMKENEIMDCLMLKNKADDYFAVLFQKYENLNNLMDSSSFYSFIYNLEAKRNSLLTVFLSKTSYPFFLLLFSIVCAYFFDRSIIPMLNESVLLFANNSESLFVYQNILKVFWISVLLVLLFVFITLLRLRSKSYLLKFYNNLYYLNSNNLLAFYFSNEFAKYYLSLLENGLSTNLIVESLIKQKANFVVSNLANDIKNSLNKGKKLTNVIEKINIELKLKQAFKIGEKTAELQKILKDYIEISDILIKRKIEKISKIITYSIYFLVSLFIALFYRLLMTPLSVIRSL